MNICILLLCISTSGIYLNNDAYKKKVTYYSLRKEYLEKIKNPSTNNQKKISNLETEFKALLFKDFLEVREEWEIENKVSSLDPPPKTLSPTILLILDNFRKDPELSPKFSDFKVAEAQLRNLYIYDLDSELASKPKNFISTNKIAKKKKEVPEEITSLNGFLLILLLPLIYLFFKKKNIYKA